MYKKARRIYRSTRGPESKEVQVITYSMATLLLAQGKDEKANETMEEAVRIHRRVAGDEHADMLDLMISQLTSGPGREVIDQIPDLDNFKASVRESNRKLERDPAAAREVERNFAAAMASYLGGRRS
mmetsp:Transcript_41761/g.97429  ORF Transcript_41761/g.97429 Transcript_41761/m.97429 type:complete len:127 (+) Transcript_41761:119-499(+)